MFKKKFILFTLMCALSSQLIGGVENTPREIVKVKNKNSYQLVLYTNPNCPYCKKVTEYLESQGRKIPIKNTQDRSVRNELISIGGKGQVPCLVINGKALYESDAIIDWLKNHP